MFGCLRHSIVVPRALYCGVGLLLYYSHRHTDLFCAVVPFVFGQTKFVIMMSVSEVIISNTKAESKALISYLPFEIITTAIPRSHNDSGGSAQNQICKQRIILCFPPTVQKARCRGHTGLVCAVLPFVFGQWRFVPFISLCTKQTNGTTSLSL